MDNGQRSVALESGYVPACECHVTTQRLYQVAHTMLPALQIRKQLATEFTSDLKNVAEENQNLLRESLSSSLEKMFAAPVTIASDDEGGEMVHPDMDDQPPRQTPPS